MNVSVESAPRSRFAPDPLNLLRLGVLLGPLSAVLIAAKIHKAVVHATPPDVSSVLSVLSEDLIGLALLWVLFALGLGDRRRPISLAVAALVHVLAPVLTLLAIFEHGFFIVTGAIGDGFILGDTLSRISELTGVIGSVITPAVWLAFASPFLISVGLAVWLHRARKRSTSAQLSLSDWQRPPFRFVLAHVLLMLVVGLGASFLPVPPSLRSLAHVFYYTVSRDLVALGRGAEDEGLAELAETEQELSLVPTEPREGAPHAKNVVLITLESVGARNTSLYTPELKNTPFLESLGKRGAKVERAYTVTPHTSKALVSIHCGRYPKLVPSVEEANAGGIPGKCLARLLSEQGFATAFFQPAEEHYERRSDLVKEFGFKHYAGKESFNGKGFDEASYFGWEDDVMINPVVEWAAQQKSRFLIGILTLTSHHPYGVPRGFQTRDFVPQRDRNDYLNTLAYTDRFLKKLFAAFEQRGLLDDTLFIVMGDHGEAFGEHARYQHDSVIYEETARVPMVVVGPGVKPGSTITGLRQHIDILPTAVEALGFGTSRPVEGSSLFTSAGHDQVFLNCFYLRYCMGFVREPSQKVIYNFDRRGTELYDLAADPDERDNLASRPENERALNAAVADLSRLRRGNDALYAVQARLRRDKYVKRSRPTPSHALNVDFGTVKIIGYDLERPEFEVGDKTVITTYYEVLQEPASDVRLFMHVRGPQPMAEDHVPVEGAYPVSDWKAGDFVIDRHTITTRPDWRVGEYEIWTGLFDPRARLPIRASGVPVQDNAARIASLKMTERHVDTAEFVLTERPVIKHSLDAGWGNSLRVIGIDIDKAEIKGGLKTTVTAVFEVVSAFAGRPTFTLFVTGPTAKQLPHVPVSGTYPLERFKPGEFIVDPIEIITHTRDRPGTYAVELELHDEAGQPVAPTGDPQVVHGSRIEIGRYTLLRSE